MTSTTEVYVGGRVLVLDGDTPPQEALAVRDGRVLGAGQREDMLTLAGSSAKTIDVAGATVMPGIVDTHPHLLHFAARANAVLNITDAVDHDDIVARIKRRADSTKPGEWIVTSSVGEPHYFIRRSWRDLAEGRLPDRWNSGPRDNGSPRLHRGVGTDDTERLRVQFGRPEAHRDYEHDPRSGERRVDRQGR